MNQGLGNGRGDGCRMSSVVSRIGPAIASSLPLGGRRFNGADGSRGGTGGRADSGAESQALAEPGSDLFIVYNEQRDTLAPSSIAKLENKARSLSR